MKLHPVVRDLLKDIHLHCQRYDIAETRFGVEAVNNGHLIGRMKAGRTPSLETIRRVRKFLRNGRAGK